MENKSTFNNSDKNDSIPSRSNEKKPMDSGRFSRRIFDVAPDGIAICDDKGYFLDANQAYCKMIGISYDELIGKNVESFIALEEQNKLKQNFMPELRKTGRARFDSVILHKDGTHIPIELTGVIFSYKTNPAILTIVHDLSDRKKKEAELLASEERYRILTENVTDGVIVVQDSQFKFVNHAFVTLFGYGVPGDIIGHSIDMLSCPELREYFSKEYRVHEKNDPLGSKIVSRCNTEDEREFWVEARGKNITWKGKPAMLATVRDITESKLREIAVEKEKENLFRENITLRSTMKDRYRMGDIVGKSPAIQEVYDLILKAGASDVGVAIYGESGTGKELIAKSIHQMSACSKKPFVPVNCGAVPETLFESEFFGHKKGAFTGAHKDKQGFFDLADGGTMFLDEVGEISTVNQVKLLRVLDSGGYMPIGGERIKNANVRIIVATNRDHKDMIKNELMREDFFYRVHIIPITVPTLRERREDIPLLVEYFMEKFGGDKKSKNLPLKILEAMYNYEWPGNIRELQNVLQRYITLGRIDFMDIHETEPADVMDMLVDINDKDAGLRKILDTFEKQYLVRTLEQSRWHRGNTAKILKVPVKTLYRKMKKHELI